MKVHIPKSVRIAIDQGKPIPKNVPLRKVLFGLLAQSPDTKEV